MDTRGQQGFIQIPLIWLIAAIASTVFVGGGIVLHKQDKLPFTASVATVFQEQVDDKEAEIESEQERGDEDANETLQEPDREPDKKQTDNESLRLAQELEESRIETERLKQEVEESRRLAEQRQKELLRQQEAQKIAEEKRQEKLRKQEEVRDPQNPKMPTDDPTPIEDPTAPVEERQLLREEEWTELREVISSFLSDPTLENFGPFCEQSKHVSTPETKEMLSADRNSIEIVNKTLYELGSFGLCRLYLTSNEYIFVKASLDHKIEFREDDTDSVRRHKIEYNKRIEELNQKYNFYSFPRSSPENSQNPAVHFEYVLEIAEKRPAFSYHIGIFLEWVPEEAVRNLQGQYGK